MKEKNHNHRNNDWDDKGACYLEQCLHIYLQMKRDAKGTYSLASLVLHVACQVKNVFPTFKELACLGYHGSYLLIGSIHLLPYLLAGITL